MTPKNVRVFVCVEPQDMRRGFDRLALTVRSEMGGDPRSGALFVFLSRRADRLKLLWWDHNGFAEVRCKTVASFAVTRLAA